MHLSEMYDKVIFVSWEYDQNDPSEDRIKDWSFEIFNLEELDLEASIDEFSVKNLSREGVSFLILHPDIVPLPFYPDIPYEDMDIDDQTYYNEYHRDLTVEEIEQYGNFKRLCEDPFNYHIFWAQLNHFIAYEALKYGY